MTVFIKRYPSKGELPRKEGLYHTNMGRVSFNKTFYWVDHHNFTCPCPNYWLDEVELPSEEELNEKTDLEKGSSMWFHSQGFTQGANFILNRIKK